MRSSVPRRSFAAALLIFASANTAHAECAWVLWTWSRDSTPGVPRTELFFPLYAYQTRDECFRELLKLRDADTNPPRFQYNCLPDTIDPRGGKGST